MDDAACFSGEKVYGDDLSLEGIKQWYADEELGYFNLKKGTSPEDSDYVYAYAALNEYHAYRYLRDHRFKTALALGCARGDDVEPLAGVVEAYIAIEPAEKWWRPTIGGKPARFVKPSVSGDIPCATGEIDLAISLGVLHHIANVTHVINEIARVCAKDAILVLREPISTMGDWRKPRVGLTKHERGFPLAWLDGRLAAAGFAVVRRRFCMFPLVSLAGRRLGINPYSNNSFVVFDHILCALTRWNYHYHRDNVFKKLGPGSIFYLLRKV